MNDVVERIGHTLHGERWPWLPAVEQTREYLDRVLRALRPGDVLPGERVVMPRKLPTRILEAMRREAALTYDDAEHGSRWRRSPPWRS